MNRFSQKCNCHSVNKILGCGEAVKIIRYNKRSYNIITECVQL